MAVAMLITISEGRPPGSPIIASDGRGLWPSEATGLLTAFAGFAANLLSCYDYPLTFRKENHHAAIND
jgi:hypothetical protein